jgi:choline-phosphate cytidylyltransferase
LHLRQAKLAFPSVHLIVGVFSDPVSESGSSTSSMSAPPLTERSEILRHMRWVDAVLPGVPSIPTSAWLDTQGIDLVALEEGASVDPTFEPARLAAYESLRTAGLS